MGSGVKFPPLSSSSSFSSFFLTLLNLGIEMYILFMCFRVFLPSFLPSFPPSSLPFFLYLIRSSSFFIPFFVPLFLVFSLVIGSVSFLPLIFRVLPVFRSPFP